MCYKDAGILMYPDMLYAFALQNKNQNYKIPKLDDPTNILYIQSILKSGQHISILDLSRASQDACRC